MDAPKGQQQNSGQNPQQQTLDPNVTPSQPRPAGQGATAVGGAGQSNPQDQHKVGIHLDPTRVQNALDNINMILGPVSQIVPGEPGQAIAAVSAALASPDLTNLIVFVAGLPDHLRPQAVQACKQALQAHPQFAPHFQS